jgi:hypothetical protein
MSIQSCGREGPARGLVTMKQHKFWAWATVFAFAMTMITGIKRK